MDIDGDILKSNRIKLFSCFTSIPKTGVDFFSVLELSFFISILETVLGLNIFSSWVFNSPLAGHAE